MNIRILPPNNVEGSCWQVCFGKQRVTFRSESQARQFVATLEARLQAPHPWPTHEPRIAS